MLVSFSAVMHKRTYFILIDLRSAVIDDDYGMETVPHYEWPEWAKVMGWVVAGLAIGAVIYIGIINAPAVLPMMLDFINPPKG